MVKIAQTQAVNANTPIFDMPIHLAFFGDNAQRLDTQVRDNTADQEFDIPLAFAPKWVDFDPNDIIYKTVAFTKTTEELVAQAQDDPYMMSRLRAAQQLGEHAKADQGCCVPALNNILEHDAFYAVRVQAAVSLGAGKSERAKQALLRAMSQPDSRVRAAAVSATENFLGDRALIDTLIKALHDDPSYAVQAAAAVQLGRSGDANAFNALRSESESKLQEIVAMGILDALAESRNPQAAEILLRYARPGTPERVREHALADLPKLKGALQRFDAQALASTVGDALNDQYLPVHEVADHLVDVFRLTQFTPAIELDAKASRDHG